MSKIERSIELPAREAQLVFEGNQTSLQGSVAWVPREKGLNLNFTGLQAGHYMTGMPDRGWVLRSRDGDMTWNDRTYPVVFPFGEVGDILWVKELWQLGTPIGEEGHFSLLPATGMREEDRTVFYKGDPASGDVPQWRLAADMPRWASRTLLEITDVRIVRTTPPLDDSNPWAWSCSIRKMPIEVEQHQEEPETYTRYHDHVSGREMLLVNKGRWAGWLCWHLPGGPRHMLRRATKTDRVLARLNIMIRDLQAENQQLRAAQSTPTTVERVAPRLPYCSDVRRAEWVLLLPSAPTDLPDYQPGRSGSDRLVCLRCGTMERWESDAKDYRADMMTRYSIFLGIHARCGDCFTVDDPAQVRMDIGPIAELRECRLVEARTLRQEEICELAEAYDIDVPVDTKPDIATAMQSLREVVGGAFDHVEDVVAFVRDIRDGGDGSPESIAEATAEGLCGRTAELEKGSTFTCLLPRGHEGQHKMQVGELTYWWE